MAAPAVRRCSASLLVVCLCVLGAAPPWHAVRAQSPDDGMRTALEGVFAGKVHAAPLACVLTDEQRADLRARSGRAFPSTVTLWRIDQGGVLKGWAAKDDVKGKAQPITYMVVFRPDAVIACVEILTYRESHGGEVQSSVFTRQFVGKSAASALRVGEDIRNMSGATISARAVTGGTRALALLVESLRSAGKLPAK